MFKTVKVEWYAIRNKEKLWNWDLVLSFFKKKKFYLSFNITGKSTFLLGLLIAPENIVLGLGFIDLRIQWMYAFKR